MTPVKKNRIRARFKRVDVQVDQVDKLRFYNQQPPASSNLSSNGLSTWERLKEARSPSPDIIFCSSFKKKAPSTSSWYPGKSKEPLEEEEGEKCSSCAGIVPAIKSGPGGGEHSSPWMEQVLEKTPPDSSSSSGPTQRKRLKRMDESVRRTEVIKRDGHVVDLSGEGKCEGGRSRPRLDEQRSSLAREMSSLGFSLDSKCFGEGRCGLVGGGRPSEDYDCDRRDNPLENEKEKNSPKGPSGEEQEGDDDVWRRWSESDPSFLDFTTDESTFGEQVEEDEMFVLFEDLMGLMKVEPESVPMTRPNLAPPTSEPDLNLFNSEMQQAMSCMSDADLTLAAEAMESELDAVPDCDIPQVPDLNADEPSRMILPAQEDYNSISLNTNDIFELPQMRSNAAFSGSTTRISSPSPPQTFPVSMTGSWNDKRSSTLNSRNLTKFSAMELVNCIGKHVRLGSGHPYMPYPGLPPCPSHTPRRQTLIFRDHLGNNLQAPSGQSGEILASKEELERVGEKSPGLIQAEGNVEVNGKRWLGKRISLDEGATRSENPLDVFHSLSSLSPAPFSTSLSSRTGKRGCRERDNISSQITFNAPPKKDPSLPPPATEVIYPATFGQESDERLSGNILTFPPLHSYQEGRDGGGGDGIGRNGLKNIPDVTPTFPPNPFNPSSPPAGLLARPYSNETLYSCEHREYLYGEGMFLVERNDLRLYKPGLFPIWRVLKGGPGKTLLRRFNPLKVKGIQFHYGVDKFVKYGRKRKLESYYLPVIFPLVWDNDYYQVGTYFDIPDSTRYLGYFRESASLYDSFLSFLKALAFAATMEDSSSLKDSNFNDLEIILMQLRNISVSTYFSIWFPPQLLETSAGHPKILFNRMKNSETECSIQQCDFTWRNKAKYKVSFYGTPYDPESLLSIGESRLEETEYVLCRTCCICLKHFHDLLHYKYWVFIAFRLLLKQLYKQLSPGQDYVRQDVLDFLLQDYFYNQRSFYEYQAILGRGIFARDKLCGALGKQAVATREQRPRRNVKRFISPSQKPAQTFHGTPDSSHLLTSSVIVPAAPLSAQNLATITHDLMRAARIPQLIPNKVDELSLPTSRKRSTPSGQRWRKLQRKYTGRKSHLAPARPRARDAFSPDFAVGLGSCINPLPGDSLSGGMSGAREDSSSISDIVQNLESCASVLEPPPLSLGDMLCEVRSGFSAITNTDSSNPSLNQALLQVGCFSGDNGLEDILSPASTEKLNMESPLGSDFSFTPSILESDQSSNPLPLPATLVFSSQDVSQRSKVCVFRFPKFMRGSQSKSLDSEAEGSTSCGLETTSKVDHVIEDHNGGKLEECGGNHAKNPDECWGKNTDSLQSVEIFSEEFSPVSRSSWSENACGFDNTLCNLPTPTTTSPHEKYSPFGGGESTYLDYLFSICGRPKILLSNCDSSFYHGAGQINTSEDIESRSTVCSSFEIEEDRNVEFGDKPVQEGLRLRFRKKREADQNLKARQSRSKNRAPSFKVSKSEKVCVKALKSQSKLSSSTLDERGGEEREETLIRKSPRKPDVVILAEVPKNDEIVFEEIQNVNCSRRDSLKPEHLKTNVVKTVRRNCGGQRGWSKNASLKSQPKILEARPALERRKKRKLPMKSKRPSVILTFSNMDSDTTEWESSLPGSNTDFFGYNSFTNVISRERIHQPANKAPKESTVACCSAKGTKRKSSNQAKLTTLSVNQKRQVESNNVESTNETGMLVDQGSSRNGAVTEFTKIATVQSLSRIFQQTQCGSVVMTSQIERSAQEHQGHQMVSNHPILIAEVQNPAPTTNFSQKHLSATHQLEDPWSSSQTVGLKSRLELSPDVNPRYPTKIILKTVPSDSRTSSHVAEPSVCGVNLPDLNVGYKLSPSLKITLTNPVVPKTNSSSTPASPGKLSTQSASPTLSPTAINSTEKVTTPRGSSRSCNSDKPPLRQILDSAQKLVDSLTLKSSKGIKSSVRCDLSKRFAKVCPEAEAL